MKTQLIEKETQTTLTLNNTTEDENILNAAKEDAGFEKILKFKKGEYFIGEDPVALGSEFLAHAAAWTKTWIKFVDGRVADRKLYGVARGERPAQREELDDCDDATWPKRDGKANDPWVFQHLLPLENMTTGEVVVFVTSSIGGCRAVSDLCGAYAKQKIAKRKVNMPSGQPIVQLASAEMPTKSFGKVPRPAFEIVGWDNTEKSDDVASTEATLVEITANNTDDMSDEIPF
jgi:hypothetical protein